MINNWTYPLLLLAGCLGGLWLMSRGAWHYTPKWPGAPVAGEERVYFDPVTDPNYEAPQYVKVIEIQNTRAYVEVLGSDNEQMMWVSVYDLY